MACNCGSKNKNQVWLFTAKDGSTKEYTSEIQARAAVIRQGGGKIQVKA